MPKVTFANKLFDKQQEVEDYMNGKVLNREGEPYRFFIPIFGRQSGKSYLAKRVLIDHAVNKDHVCMWVSPTINTARDHWNDLVSLLQKSGIPIKHLKQASKEIHFHGGGIIYIRSAIEPDNLRGATLDLLIMDEAAYFRNGEYAWYSVLMPMITASRGIVLFPTTPNGRNWVYKLFNRGMNDDLYYKSWHMSSMDAPYQDKKLLLDIKETMPSHKWRTEYEAEFLADAGGTFAGVEKAAQGTPLSAPVYGHSYVMGVDIGFSHDYTCFTILDKYTRHQVYGKRFSDEGTLKTIDKLMEIIDIWQPDKVNLEKNGIGENLYDIIRERFASRVNDDLDDRRTMQYGKTSITAIHMNNEIKREAVERLAADIEYGRLTILNDKNEYGETQLNEMSTYERQRTNSGLNITYNAAEGCQDDTVSALYLANLAMPKADARTPAHDWEHALQHATKNPFKNRSSAVRSHRKGRVQYAKRG